MAGSDWVVDKATGTASWNGYTVKRMAKCHGAHYWAYSPGGGLLLTGWGENAQAFMEHCEKHAQLAGMQQPA